MYLDVQMAIFFSCFASVQDAGALYSRHKCRDAPRYVMLNSNFIVFRSQRGGKSLSCQRYGSFLSNMLCPTAGVLGQYARGHEMSQFRSLKHFSLWCPDADNVKDQR